MLINKNQSMWARTTADLSSWEDLHARSTSRARWLSRFSSPTASRQTEIIEARWRLTLSSAYKQVNTTELNYFNMYGQYPVARDL